MSQLLKLLDPNNLRPVFDAPSAGRDAWRAVREDREFLARHRSSWTRSRP